MDDFENVSKLVNQTGASYEEARYAYEACGKDMLSAAIMLEKAHSKDGAQYSTSSGAKGSCESRDSGSGMDYHEAWNKARSSFRRNSRAAAGCAGDFFRKLSRNYVKVTGSREYFNIPIIAAAAIILLFWSIAVPAFIISLFCGINYTFTGPDFSKDFVFGFERSRQSSYESAQYTYTQSAENADNGFFTKK